MKNDFIIEYFKNILYQDDQQLDKLFSSHKQILDYLNTQKQYTPFFIYKWYYYQIQICLLYIQK